MKLVSAWWCCISWPLLLLLLLLLLSQVSFKVPGGSTVAFVGATGSGKSTVTRLLFRSVGVSGVGACLGWVQLGVLESRDGGQGVEPLQQQQQGTQVSPHTTLLPTCLPAWP